MVEKCIAEFGRIDILLNCNGVQAEYLPIVYAEYNQQMFSNPAKFENVTAVDNFYFAGMFTGRVTAAHCEPEPK